MHSVRVIGATAGSLLFWATRLASEIDLVRKPFFSHSGNIPRNAI